MDLLSYLSRVNTGLGCYKAVRSFEIIEINLLDNVAVSFSTERNHILYIIGEKLLRLALTHVQTHSHPNLRSYSSLST